MNILKTLAIAGVALLLAIPAQAASLPTSIENASGTLTLNGSGTRSKLFIKLYKAGLYLTEPSSDAKAVISGDETMGIQLNIISDLITAEKMEKATMEGFSKSTGGDLSPIAAEIDQFMSVFKSGIKDGDSYRFIYQSGAGTAVSKNGEPQTTVMGLPFKQALFGIWLGEQPVQGKLKKGMLGK